MLSFVLTDIFGKRTTMKCPLRVSLVSSKEAPADGLTASFAVCGEAPVMSMIEMTENEECLFRGIVDRQTERQGPGGCLLTVCARSLAAILLDNEALPQTYCLPSMPLLMERHFKRLGFYDFIGEDNPFNGEMTISKGMSEWAVLKSFCEVFTGTEPRVTREGIIDISGENREQIFISRKRLLSLQRSRNRSALVSELLARTRTSGGYEMPLKSKLAEKMGVVRRRYVNSIDSKSRTVLTARAMLKSCEDSFEVLKLTVDGRLVCSVGARLYPEGEEGDFLIDRIEYVLDENGERTNIDAHRIWKEEE